MVEKAAEVTSTPPSHDSVEIGAAGAIVEAMAMPLMTVLLAEAEALAALIPGHHPDLTPPVKDRADSETNPDPFDNMPV
jgi:hypothetical protein